MNVFRQLERRRRWSEEERLLLDQVARLCAEAIAPNAAKCDREAAFPWASIEALDRLGLNALFVPERYGGTGGSYRLYLAVVRLISEACAATGIIYATSFHGMGPVVDHGSEAQKSRFLPRIAQGSLGALAITEPEAGSDATGMQTRFRPDGGDIVVDGGKIFITNGDVADLILLFGKWSEIEDPRKAISALVLEKGTPGFEILRLEDKMGHRASSTAEIAFRGCHVPRANLLGEPGDGLPILLASLNKSRPSIAAHALGIAHAAFSDMTDYANQRRQFGKRLVEFQGNQFTLADLATDLAMAEHWLDHLGALVDEGETEFGVEASMAKMRASDLAMRIATECVQMHGGYGYCQGYRAERLMRDAKITQIWEGTNQIHRQLIGRSFART
ncbi:acyl-CoA dehydrogenase family protein [Bosea sp. (in: a-proteobacteria)]|uniref:acyl-CoA dehydrogenase family protein n=1 Tax=Bosea sp. (in: a-proteobacteria) TaxID=1871050 RepID=UPI001ACC952D|nr:acyl-CoA dehydrogenase family protein [Bosea sp. (in: a-proteobacteria)]MBN9439620.1 acyl-CoA dehydrogenase family protein [Bosea sp. (in: a-proteobacteria)]